MCFDRYCCYICCCFFFFFSCCEWCSIGCGIHNQFIITLGGFFLDFCGRTKTRFGCCNSYWYSGCRPRRGPVHHRKVVHLLIRMILLLVCTTVVVTRKTIIIEIIVSIVRSRSIVSGVVIVRRIGIFSIRRITFGTIIVVQLKTILGNTIRNTTVITRH